MGNTSSDLSKKYKKVSPVREVMSLLVRNKAAMAGLIFLILLVGVSLSADLLFDYESQVVEQNISERLQWPSVEHLFGTDEYGRDLLARVVHGSRLSLSVSFVSVLASLIIGGILGAVSGYYGGLLDEIIMRITDIFLAIPMTLLAMVIVAALGASTTNLIISLSLSAVPTFARIVRSSVLTVREVEYIEGRSHWGEGWNNHFQSYPSQLHWPYHCTDDTPGCSYDLQHRRPFVSGPGRTGASAGVGSTFVGWKKLYPGLQLSDLYSRSCHHAHDPGAESSGRRAAGCSGPETEIGGHYGGKDD